METDELKEKLLRSCCVQIDPERQRIDRGAGAGGGRDRDRIRVIQIPARCVISAQEIGDGD